MNEAKRSRVFISYAHEDLPTIHQIVDGLKKRKVDVWFDKEQLAPGRWKQQITKAIAQSRYFVICISEAALRKTGSNRNKVGFQDEELNAAYNIAQDQPDKEFAIVPVRLEDCDRGDFRLTSFQQYDLFTDFEKELDELSVNMGGISLSDAKAKDVKTEDERIIEGLIGKAAACFYAGDFEKAINVLFTALEIDPGYAKAWYSKGVLLVTLGRHEEALEACNKALEIDHGLGLRGTSLNTQITQSSR